VLPGILLRVPMFFFLRDSGGGVAVCEGKKRAQEAHGGRRGCKGVLRK